MKTIQRTIKYDVERDPGFAREIRSMPGCDRLQHCIQCGTCSGTCPMSIYMDFTPRRLIALTRAGFKDDVLRSLTIWLCSSCYACTVECPRDIHVTDVMYALKQRAIRDGAYPRRFPIPVLAREFFKMVRSKGRTTESRLVLRLFRMWRLGLNLVRRGRFSLAAESIRARDELKTLLEDVDSGKGAA